VTFFDRRVNRKRIKLMFGMKMIEKIFPDFFCLVLLLKRKILLADF